MSEEYQIKDLSSLHHYRTELPNIIFELGLTADHIGVYSLLKRVAGDRGCCFYSNPRLAEKLKMTAKTFANFKDDLTKPFELLGGMPLIQVQQRNSPEKGQQSDLVTIVDVWPINMLFMSKKIDTPPLVKFTTPPLQNLLPPLVKITDEEEPIKKNHIKEASSACSLLSFSDQEKESLNNFTSDQIKQAEQITHDECTSKTQQARKKFFFAVLTRIQSEPKKSPPPDNRAHAIKVQSSIAKTPPHVYYEILAQHVEVGYKTGQNSPSCLAYTEKGFADQLDTLIRKYGMVLKPKE